MKRDGKKNFIALLQPQSQSPTFQRNLMVTFGHTSRDFSLLSTKGVMPNGCFYNCGFQSISRWQVTLALIILLVIIEIITKTALPLVRMNIFLSSVLLYYISMMMYKYYVLCCNIKYTLAVEVTVKKNYTENNVISRGVHTTCLPSLETSWRYGLLPVVTRLPSSSKTL